MGRGMMTAETIVLARMADLEEGVWSGDYPTGVNRQRELRARGSLVWPHRIDDAQLKRSLTPKTKVWCGSRKRKVEPLQGELFDQGHETDSEERTRETSKERER